MHVVDLRRKPLNPRQATNFMDSCAFDPKYSPEHEAAEEIRMLGRQLKVNLVITHSIKKEIDHPSTPQNVKDDAASMFHTYQTVTTSKEEARERRIHAILTGTGSADKHLADATHVFDAGKYGGCFITVDERILRKSAELSRVWPIFILKPSAWLVAFHAKD